MIYVPQWIYDNSILSPLGAKIMLIAVEALLIVFGLAVWIRESRNKKKVRPLIRFDENIQRPVSNDCLERLIEWCFKWF